MHQAVTTLEACEQLVAERSVRGFMCTEFYCGRAEARLAEAEEAPRPVRKAHLTEAKRACRAALRQSRLDRGARPVAYRLWGTYEWLRRNQRAAQAWWRRSAALCQDLHATHELGSQPRRSRAGPAAILAETASHPG